MKTQQKKEKISKIKEVEETKEIILEEKQKKANKDIFLDYIPYLIIIIVVIIIRTFIATPVRVNGSSMDTTLKNGETMILNKLGMKVKGIKRWDIIVIKTETTYLIKRVIALPGESIKYEEGQLFINDVLTEDKYSKTLTEDFEEVKVGKNEYFVMGDNRFVSQDSRIIGAVDKSEIKGKTNIIIFPLDRFGKVK